MILGKQVSLLSLSLRNYEQNSNEKKRTISRRLNVLQVYLHYDFESKNTIHFTYKKKIDVLLSPCIASNLKGTLNVVPSKTPM